MRLITYPHPIRSALAWHTPALAWCAQDERIAIIRDELKPGAPEDERNWDVLLTTYEVANIEKTALNKIGWRYLIIDEAHRCVKAHAHYCCLFVVPHNTADSTPYHPLGRLREVIVSTVGRVFSTSTVFFVCSLCFSLVWT